MNRALLALIGALTIVAPGVVKAVTYTHFVLPNGSDTSFCTQREPCSLSRAVSLVGGPNMRPGSTVLVQYGTDGVYSQGALTFEGSGTAESPIKFIGENRVRLTGTRFKPDVARFTLVPGRQYTYQLDWDEQANFPAGSAAQRPPVKTWRPILVDDRLPPFTRSLGRPFTLDFPIRYTQRSSVDEVEANHCTIWNDRAANKVYVHMCHDGRPTVADNLYLGTAGWGSVVIDGDYIWLENLAFEHANGTGLKVNPSANGTVLKKIEGRAAQVWLEGTNTLAEDIEVSHVIAQGLHPTQCYDANPTFGAGECWNAGGDGRALLIGREGRTTSFGQVVRRAKVHRSWNGGRIDGRNTLEYSTFWSFPNHTLEASGTGTVIRHSAFVNGQDSIYLEGNPFDDLTVEHNVFANSTLFWVSRDRSGGTPPSAWRLQYNILPVVVYDDKTYASVTADCNAWIPSSPNANNLVRVTGTDGGREFGYSTLEEVQARTPLEHNSIWLPSSKWTDGTVFRYFQGPSTAVFDFSPISASTALTACGQQVGPDTRSLSDRAQNFR